MVSLLRVAGVVTCIATLASPLASQRTAPATYAITNARLVPVSAPAIEQGTVVIRGGLIVAVGATVAVPADARVIDGTGLTIYPGLIDGFGTLGMPSATPAPAGAAAPGGGGGRGGGGAAAAEARMFAAFFSYPRKPRTKSSIPASVAASAILTSLPRASCAMLAHTICPHGQI